MGDPDREDVMIWLREEDKGFMVKSMCETLCAQKSEFSSGICAWNPLI